MYTVRRYEKGQKNSGTRDLWVGEYIPSESEILRRFGPRGKFVVFERGKGIRGMRKVTEYGPYEGNQREWLPHTFSAEDSIAVRKEIRLSELADEELSDLLDSMMETPVESESDFDAFIDDVKRVKSEMVRRMTERAEGAPRGESVDVETVVDNPPVVAAAEGSQSGRFGVTTVVVVGLTGLVVGSVLQEVRWRRKEDDLLAAIHRLERRLERMERTRKSSETYPSNPNLFNAQTIARFNAREGF